MKIARLPSVRRKNLITTLILAIGLPILIFASYQVINLITNAGAESTPKNVVISNLTTSSVTISWSTEQSTKGSVISVLNGQQGNPIVDKRGNDNRKTHYVELTDLEPNTSYEYIIVSNTSNYTDSNGEEFTFKTAPVTSTAPTPNPIYGSVSGASGDDVIVYAFLKDKSTYPVSATIPSGGNWIMDLSSLRNLSDKDLVIANDSTNLTLVAISGVTSGDVIEGSYSELFDSNGKLKDTYSLSLEANENLYSYFPSATKITVTAQEPEEEDDTPVVVTPPVVTDTEEPEEEFEREYSLTQDLKWIDMVTAESGPVITGSTGEESVVITNKTDVGFTVIWASENKEEGKVVYGTSETEMTDEASDERDGLTNKGEYYIHSVNITMLEPETDYFFKILSGEEEIDNGGYNYAITTFATLSSPPPFQSITGTVSGIETSEEVAVIGYFNEKDEQGTDGDSLKISTMTDEDGKWIMSIADVRSEDGSEYYESTDGDDLVLSVVSLVESDSQVETVSGIDDRDIEIAIEDTGEVTVQSKVQRLEGYGILGVGDIQTTDDSNDSSGDSVNTVQSGNTPQTGILGNIFLVIGLGLFLGFGSLLFKKRASTY